MQDISEIDLLVFAVCFIINVLGHVGGEKYLSLQLYKEEWIIT
jgi:hypothetical protein